MRPIDFVKTVTGIPYYAQFFWGWYFGDGIFGQKSISKINDGNSHTLKYLIQDNHEYDLYSHLFVKIDTLYGKFYRNFWRNDKSIIHERSVREEGEVQKQAGKLGVSPVVFFVGNNYYVCEYIYGDTALEYIKKNPKKLDWLLKNIYKVYDKIDKHKIFHDGNPKNIMVSGKKIYLIDFQYVNRKTIKKRQRVKKELEEAAKCA